MYVNNLIEWNERKSRTNEVKVKLKDMYLSFLLLSIKNLKSKEELYIHWFINSISKFSRFYKYM